LKTKNKQNKQNKKPKNHGFSTPGLAVCQLKNFQMFLQMQQFNAKIANSF